VDGSERDDDFIRIKGSILLERHIKYHEIATKRSQEDNFEAMKGVTAMEKLNSNNPVPLVNRENSMSFSHNKAGRTFN
jgi:hypothetical protein